jgi:hypothetical protein
VSDRTDRSSQQAADAITPVQPRPDSRFGPSIDIAWGEVGGLQSVGRGPDADPLGPIADFTWAALARSTNADDLAVHTLAWDDAAWANEPARFADLTAGFAEPSALSPVAAPAATEARQSTGAAMAITAGESGGADRPPFIATTTDQIGLEDVAGGGSYSTQRRTALEAAPASDAAAFFPQHIPETQVSADGTLNSASQDRQASAAEPRAPVLVAGAPPFDASNSGVNAGVAIQPGISAGRALEANATALDGIQPPPSFVAAMPSVEVIQLREAEPAMPIHEPTVPRPAEHAALATHPDTAAAPADGSETAVPSSDAPIAGRPVGRSDRRDGEAASRLDQAAAPLPPTRDLQRQASPSVTATVDESPGAGDAVEIDPARRSTAAPVSAFKPASPARTISVPLPTTPGRNQPNGPANSAPTTPSSVAPNDAVQQDPVLAQWRSFYLDQPASDLGARATSRSPYPASDRPTAPRPERASPPASFELPTAASQRRGIPPHDVLPLTPSTMKAPQAPGEFSVAPSPQAERAPAQPSDERPMQAEFDRAVSDQPFAAAAASNVRQRTSPLSEVDTSIEQFRQNARDPARGRQRAMTLHQIGAPLRPPDAFEPDRSPDHVPAERSGEGRHDRSVNGERGSAVAPGQSPAAPAPDLAAMAVDSSAVGNPSAATRSNVAGHAASRPRAEAVLPSEISRLGNNAERFDKPSRDSAAPIRISIGRITVESPAAAAPSPPFRRPRPPLSLNDYLDRRRSE